MSFGVMTYGDISPRVGLYAVANFLAHAEPVLILERFAKVEQLPKNKGQVVKWRRFVPFAIRNTSKRFPPAGSKFPFATVKRQTVRAEFTE